jgi:lipopolysaccharide heptosyltransferase II
MADTIHRTLIIRLSSVGDIILSSLMVRMLRKRFPASTIDFLVKQEYADLMRYNPAISRVIEFPSDGGIADLRRVHTQIHAAPYDLLIDIHSSLRSRYLCFGHARVVRIKKRKIARFMLVKAKWDIYDWFGGAPGVAERYLETVRSLGVENDGNGLEVFFPQAAAAHAEKVLVEAGIQSQRTLIGICPSARHSNKMWLKERFAETAATLAREHRGAVLLFGSGNHEETRCQEVKTMIEQPTQGIPVLNLAGRLSLLETAAMMDRCSIVVTNDSGLMHLATARKRKVVTIFGPTVRELGFFPYGTTSTVIENISLSCRPCTHIGLPYCPKGHFKCMNDIHAVQVIDAAQVLLKPSPDR